MKAALNMNLYIIFILGRKFLCFHITAFELKCWNKFGFFLNQKMDIPVEGEALQQEKNNLNFYKKYNQY